jgi:hypothetical protein
MHYSVATGELFVIVEYCRYGNLQSYLINHRNNFVNQVDKLGNLLSDAEMQEIHTAGILRFCFIPITSRE